jgi:YesN/AraC family two-component response regulator
MIDEALRLGAKGFVVKPVKAEQLEDAIQKIRAEAPRAEEALHAAG